MLYPSHAYVCSRASEMALPYIWVILSRGCVLALRTSRNPVEQLPLLLGGHVLRARRHHDVDERLAVDVDHLHAAVHGLLARDDFVRFGELTMIDDRFLRRTAQDGLVLVGEPIKDSL